MEEKYYSQYGQDKWLEENLFKNKKDGVFLEIGADDGIDKSNTLLFEKKGWQGLCIEPSPKRYKLLKKNRHCLCENIAISNSIGKKKFLDISGWGKGLSGIIDYYDEEHKDRIKFELDNPENKGSKIVKVKTDKLSNILSKYNIKNVDFCSIDVEGGEMDVIKSIDFSDVNIRVIMVENNYNKKDVYNYLIKKGFIFIKRIEIDDIYVQKENIIAR
jgi:FkbM family methyltransferase